MTTTRATLRQNLQELYYGDYWSLTSTAAGDSDTIVCSALAERAEGDDAFPGWWALNVASGHAGIGEERRVKGSGGYTASTTSLEFNYAFGTTLGDAKAFELSRYAPADYHIAINRAIEQLHPTLYLPIKDETLIVDNLLSNSDMETYAATVFTGWTEVGSPTSSEESTIVFHGTNSAKLVASGAVGQMTQAPSINIDEVTGKTAHAGFRVYATDANAARIRLDWDGSNFENSSYHSGNDQWELLKVSGAVPSTATQVKVILEVADGYTAYFDLGYLYIDPIYRYTVLSTIIGEPHFLSMQYDEDDANGSFYAVRKPTPGRLLRVEGKGYLSRPTTDTGTTEVDGARVNLILARAAIIMCGIQMAKTTSSDEIAVLEGIRDRAIDDYNSLIRRSGIAMPGMSADKRETWYTDEDSSGKVIVFTGAR